VVGVVSDHVCGEIADRYAASFGVNSESVPLLGAECAEEVQVGFAEQAVKRERIIRIAGGVVAQVCPEVLVKAGEGDARLLDDLAVAPCGGDLVFGEVGENLGDGPLARRGPGDQPLGGNVGDEFGYEGWGLRLGGEGVSGCCEIADAGEVVGCVGHRV